MGSRYIDSGHAEIHLHPAYTMELLESAADGRHQAEPGKDGLMLARNVRARDAHHVPELGERGVSGR